MTQFSRAPERARTNSRALWRISWRRMRRRPLQYVLLIIGVALGIAMIVSIDIANSSARRAFALSSEAVTGRATHRIIGGPAGLDETIYGQLKTKLGFDQAAPIVEEFVLSPQLGNKPYRLIGIDPFAEIPFRDFFSGSKNGTVQELVQLISEPNTIVLSQETAGIYDVILGDILQVNHSGHLISMKVVGFIQAQNDSGRQGLADLIFTDISSAQDSLNMVGRLSHIDLIVKDVNDLGPIRGILPGGVRIEIAAARGNALQQMSRAFEVNLTALSLLAMIVGMFLIYNTVTFSVIQRRSLFGILRCLGVTGGQLFSLILLEVLLLGFVGGLLGLGLGLLLGRGMVTLVSQTINDFYFVVNVRDVNISLWTLLKGLSIGLLAAGLAALVPAWEAMSTAPESGLIRSRIESRTRKMLGWFILIFVTLAGIGVIFLTIKDANLFLSFAGLFTILVAFAFLTPALTSILMHLTTPLTAFLSGPIGRMAPRDISRSLSRTSIAIAALMIAVSVIIGVSIMVGSFRKTVDQWLGDTLQADVYLSPPNLTANRIAGSLDPEVVEVARAWPGVEGSVSAWRTDIMAPDLGRTLEIVAVDGDISAGNRRYAWIDGDRSDLWIRLKEGQGVLLSEPLILKEDLGLPPEPILLITESGPRLFPVLAVYYDYSSDQGTILIDQGHYLQWWTGRPATSLGLFIEPRKEAEEITAELREYFMGRQDLIIQSNISVKNNALDIFDQTFAITMAVQLLAIIVAFIGVLSALMSLQLERTQEFGVLRATGMTVNQLWKLILLETSLMGATAGLLAMPVGWILALVLIYVINRRSFGWTLDMDLEPTYFLQAFIIALLAALLAGLFPAARAGRMVIASAIREE